MIGSAGRLPEEKEVLNLTGGSAIAVLSAMGFMDEPHGLLFSIPLSHGTLSFRIRLIACG